ncbi:hypothetical protein D3C81_1069570 [compost metagenome]
MSVIVNGRSWTSAPSAMFRMAVDTVAPSGTKALPRNPGLLADSRCLAGISLMMALPSIGLLPPNHIWARISMSPSSRPPMQITTMAVCARM